ncbi:hypothetical protein CPB84DRAFT_1817630 [Gymnopilus junonius]|uniref:OTU domain-containing protein n=1 Tax=Gymnopilus junonius TaxID=109634 RepID=A0A9P5NB64_GYMJU|nr:hypothetical protein CPB84DRAFT_1817630 [Gymnopilus junonius]
MGKRNQKGGKGPLPHLRSRTTRSSRGRLIPLQPSPSLPDQLRLLGLYAAPTLGDGNCLFRALADQVYGSPVRHAEVRREVCDWIEKWGERYEGRLESYLRNMRENGTYGGHMELSAFAHMTRRNIKVVQPGLVYVIEWRAGSGSSVSSSSTPGTSNSNASASPSAPPSTVATSTNTSKYHDWEHFSSIRNLRGPHSGLPNIQETLAYDYADAASPSAPASSASASAPPSKGLSEKEALKEREREKKKERERKEKEREKERREKGKGALKVKLKLASAPVSTASASPSAAMSKPASTSSTPAPANTRIGTLPTSRSASPFTTVPGFGSGFGYGAGYASSPLTSLPSSASIWSVDSESQDQSQPQPQPQSQPQPIAPRTQHRSPKRSFDESSASGGDGEESERSSRSQGGCTGTPALSAPGTSSSSSSESSSEVASELSSPPASVSPSPPPDVDVVISGTASMPLLPPSALEPSSIKSPLSHHGAKLKPKNRYQHPEKGLTRRQRKALGLPKARPGMHVNASGVHAGAGDAAGLSAGKIVIPGGRWTGREASAPAVAGGGGAGAGAEAEEEWRRNGTGRLDVRGFRELKI